VLQPQSQLQHYCAVGCKADRWFPSGGCRNRMVRGWEGRWGAGLGAPVGGGTGARTGGVRWVA